MSLDIQHTQDTLTPNQTKFTKTQFKKKIKKNLKK